MTVDDRSLSGDFGYHRAGFQSGARSWLTEFNRLPGQVKAAVAAVGRIILVWECRRRSRQALRSLDRREMRDFCLDPMETEREAGKPFWRP